MNIPQSDPKPKRAKTVNPTTPYSLKPLTHSAVKVAYEPECFNIATNNPNNALSTNKLRLLICFQVHSAAETDLLAEAGVQIT